MIPAKGSVLHTYEMGDYVCETNWGCRLVAGGREKRKCDVFLKGKKEGII